MPREIGGSMAWWLLAIIAVVGMWAFSKSGPNAVWGTATFGLLVGLVTAFFQPHFEWSIVGKGLVLGAISGLAFELLPRLVRR